MNEHPSVNPPGEEWETTVRETARHFPYPETPDIAAGIQRRMYPPRRRIHPVWRIAAALLLALLILTLAVPEVRAVVLDFIQIGALRIFPLEPSRTPVAATLTPQPFYGAQPPRLHSVLDMPGETTLDNARARSAFAFNLPADLGLPNHVYLQDYGDQLVTLVWTVPDHPDQARLTLEIFNEHLLASKLIPIGGSEGVRLNNGDDALWMPASSIVVYMFQQNNFMLERDISASVLAWTDKTLTYRLEGSVSKDEAIRIAESVVK